MYRQGVMGVLIWMLWGLCACTTPQSTEQPASDQERVVGRPDGIKGAEAIKRATKKRRGALWYMISKSKKDAFSVKLRLLHPPKRTSLFLPGPWAGRKDHAKSIRIQGAFGPKGARPWTLVRNQDRIDIDTTALPWVEFHYEVKLKIKHSIKTRFSPQKLNSGFFAYAPTIFILPSDQLARQLQDIPIEVRVPKNWKVISTWKLKQKKASQQAQHQMSYGYLVRDIHTLRDAFLAADPTLHQYKSKDASIRIAFEQQFKGPRAEIGQMIEKIIKAYRKRYGHLGATSIFVRTNPKPHKTLWGTGRRGGFILELPPAAAVNDALKILIAHEAFHLWNGHLLIPNPKSEAKTRWFKEGLTHYVALQTLASLKIISQRTLLEELAQAAQRYDAHTSSPQTTPHLAQRYPYDRGMILATQLAAKLHIHSQGKQSLHDWLTRLLTRAQASPHWLYDDNALRRQLLDSAPTMSSLLSSFWRKHVVQNRPIQLKAMFASLGLHWLEPTASRKAKLIPLAQPQPAFEALFELTPSTTPTPSD